MIQHVAGHFVRIGHAVERPPVAPTLVTFGRHDMATSTRFAGPLKAGIAHSELFVFEGCSHAPIYQRVEDFNRETLAFLRAHTG